MGESSDCRLDLQGGLDRFCRNPPCGSRSYEGFRGVPILVILPSQQHGLRGKTRLAKINNVPRLFGWSGDEPAPLTWNGWTQITSCPCRAPVLSWSGFTPPSRYVVEGGTIMGRCAILLVMQGVMTE